MTDLDEHIEQLLPEMQTPGPRQGVIISSKNMLI